MTRKEAIRWLTNEKWTNANNKYKKEWNEAFDLAIEALSDRPTDEWCTDCKEYDHEKHYCPRFNRVIRTTLNEAVANLKEEFASAEYEDYEHATLVDIKEPLKVLVVRCKDCRFWKNEHLCLVMSRYGSIDTKAEHYCSWGERREK